MSLPAFAALTEMWQHTQAKCTSSERAWHPSDGNSHSVNSGLEIVSHQALMDSLPNNPTSWEVLILRCWLPLGIPQSTFVCVNCCAVIFTQQLPTLDFFHPESFARDLNPVLTNHPGRNRGVEVWAEVLHNKNFRERLPWDVILSKVVSLSANVTLCLAFCSC